MGKSEFQQCIEKGFILVPDEDGNLPTENNYVINLVVNGKPGNTIECVSKEEREHLQRETEACQAMGML